MAKEIDFSNVFDGVQTRPIVGEEHIEAEKAERKKIADAEKAVREKKQDTQIKVSNEKTLKTKPKKGSRDLQEKKITVCFSYSDYEKLILKVLKKGMKDKKPLQPSVFIKKIVLEALNEK